MKGFILILFLSSCQVVHLLNTTKPENESIEEINRFLESKKYVYDASVHLSDSFTGLRKSEKYLLSDSSKIASLIQVRVFDSTGKFYTAFSQCFGDFKKNNFITGMPINKNNHPFFNKELTFQNELLIFDITEKQKNKLLIDSKPYKYKIVVYWNMWTNYFSKKVLKQLSDLKKEYSDDIYLILCNSAYN